VTGVANEDQRKAMKKFARRVGSAAADAPSGPGEVTAFNVS
jgi:hypothetical protein